MIYRTVLCWTVLYRNDNADCNDAVECSKLIVPTFLTKLTEHLGSGWVFVSSDKLQLFN